MAPTQNSNQITTPVGSHKVVLKSYITGRDRRRINGVFLEAASFTVSGDATTETAPMSGTVVAQAEDAAIDCVVISVDGESQDVVDKVLDMHSDDMKFVVEAVNKVTESLPEEKKSD